MDYLFLAGAVLAFFGLRRHAREARRRREGRRPVDRSWFV